MTSKILIAAASVSLLFAANAMAADAPKPPPMSNAMAKALTEAQKAETAKDFPAALKAIDKAKAVSSPTPYDTLMMNRVAMDIYIRMNDLANAEVYAVAAAETDPSAIPDADKASVYKPAVQLAVNAKHADKAVKFSKLWLAATPPPTGGDLELVTSALYNGGDMAGAAALAQKNIDAAIAAGKKPVLSDLQILRNAQVAQNDQPGAEKTLEMQVASYDKPQDWALILSVAMTTRGMRDIDYVYLGRLMLQQARPIAASDAQLVGTTANKMALYGDAEAMQKAGGPPADAREVADKKSVPAQITAGAKANGEYNVKLAEVLYGYGMYPEAIAAAQLSKTKGGASDPNEADMVIAMTQSATGQYAAANATFAGIKATSPATARVVRLWGYFTKLKASPATAAAQ